MKSVLITSLLVVSSLSAFAQVQVDRQIQMTGTTPDDRRITNVSNAAEVAPVGTDAININTVQRNYVNYSSGTFSGGTYNLLLTPAPTAYWPGMRVTFRADGTNTGATNLNVNGLGNRALVKANGSALTAGEISLGQIVEAVFDGANDRFQLVSPQGANAWTTLGNAGTDPANNFLGTTDNQGLAFRTNNLERMRILNTGQVAVNSTTTFPTSTFYSAASGNNNAIDGSAAGTGRAVYGQNTGTGVGVVGLSDNAIGWGVGAYNINATGTGLITVGNGSGLYNIFGGAGAVFNGVPIGAVAYGNRSADGWGILAAGNDGLTSTIAGGGGGSFSGRQWGVFAVATISGAANNGIDRAAFVGNYIYNNALGSTVYVGARIGGTHYKILGTTAGSVSTTMPTRDGERILFAPEAPENWFFDIGEVVLVNGKATVELDPLFVDCISDSKPFKVFVQGSENTIGSIKITRNQANHTFEVEDLGGPSNGVVQYCVYGIWKTKENLRFPKYTKPEGTDVIHQQKVKMESPKINISK
jgi:hypothetical protein